MDRATKNVTEHAAPAPRRTTRMTKPLFNASAIHEGNFELEISWRGGNCGFLRQREILLRDRYVFFLDKVLEK